MQKILEQKICNSLRANWYSSIEASQKFDLILSNPPYIKPGDEEISPDLQHEPPSALYSDKNGFQDIEFLIRGLDRHLHATGSLICEIGRDQSFDFTRLLEDVYQQELKVVFNQDIQGINRVALVNRRLEAP